MKSPKSDIVYRMIRMTPPIRATRCLRSCRQARASGGRETMARCRCSASAAMGRGRTRRPGASRRDGPEPVLVIADSWISEGQPDVGPQIAQDQREASDEQTAQDHVKVLLHQGLEEEPAQPRPADNVLQDRRPAEQSPDFEAEDRDQRDDGVAHGMLVDYRPFRP